MAVVSDLSLDPADGFCELYDWGVDEIGPNDLDDAHGRLAESMALAEEIRRVGQLPAGIRVEDPVDVAVALIGIDAALGDVTRAHSSLAGTARLPGLWKRFLMSGMLNESAPGALLQKRCNTTRQGPADHITEALLHVTRVPVRTWKRVTHVLMGSNDLDPHLPGQPLRIACCALSDDMRDFQLREPPNASDAYRLGPNPARFTKRRLMGVLDALDQSGAELAVLPEATLDADVLDRWSALMRATAPPTASSLRWVLVGTGPVVDADPPPNRAVVLDRSDGRMLFTQDKRFRFTLPPHTIKSYGLSAELPSEVAHKEDINAGRDLTVVESVNARFVIAVCEDLSRLMDDAEHWRTLAPDYVLVPIFSREIDDNDWQHVNAGMLEGRVGATVVVCNSGAVRQRRLEIGEKVTSGVFAIARSPYHEALGYPGTKRGKLAGPSSVVVFELHQPPA